MKYGVGIDISKGKSTVSILSEYGEVIEMPFEINHDSDGLNHLSQEICPVCNFLGSRPALEWRFTHNLCPKLGIAHHTLI